MHACRPPRRLLRGLLGLVLLMSGAFVVPADAGFAAMGSGGWPPHPYSHSVDGSTWGEPVSDVFNPIKGIAYGGGTWVAVGGQGLAFTSSDGAQWETHAAAGQGQFRGIAYGEVGGGRLFVAVGATNFAATQAVHTSPDGATWMAHAITPAVGSVCFPGACWDNGLKASFELRAVAHGTPGGVGTFVAVGTTGIVFKSTDGSTWVPQATGLIDDLVGIAWGSGRFLAVGNGASKEPHIWESLDGASWILRHTGVPGQAYTSIAHGGGAWVVAGYPSAAGETLLFSPDGITWSAQTSGAQWPRWNAVSYGAGTWVAVSNEQVNQTSRSSAVAISADGRSWETRPANAAAFWGFYAVAHGNALFVAAGESIVRSHDGRDWIHTNGMAGGEQFAVVASNGKTWAAGGVAGTMQTSQDGRNWTARYTGLSCCSVSGIAYGAGQWIAVAGGRTLSSPDGIHWTVAKVAEGSLTGIGFRAGQWVAVGLAGNILQSGDGVEWQAVPSGTSAHLRGVAWGQGRWTAVGDGGIIRTSTDGFNWGSTPSGTTSNLNAVAFDRHAAGATWVAVGSAGTIRTSRDGLAWTPSASGTTAALTGIARGDGKWVAVGGDDAYHSDDATSGNWIRTRAGYGLNAVASDRIQDLECLPATQRVARGSPARIGGGGGEWPYSWSYPAGARNGSPEGAVVTPSFDAPGTYVVSLSDASSVPRGVECVVEVVPDAQITPAQACGYGFWTTDSKPEIFQWQEIDPVQGGGGTPIVGLPANYAYSLQTNFTFDFCGQSYTDFWLAAAGHLCMSQTPVVTGQFVRFPAPTNCGPIQAFGIPSAYPWQAKPAVFGLWTYLAPQTCGARCLFYKIEGSAPSRTLIYEFKGVPFGGNSATLVYHTQTFQIKLFEGTNCVEVHYADVSSSNYFHPVSAGFQDAQGVFGHQAFYHEEHTAWSHMGEAWRACPMRAYPDEYVLNEDQVAQAFDVTANDILPLVGANVTAWTQPQKGDLVRTSGPGGFAYRPHKDAVGRDSFEYVLKAVHGSVTTKVNITLNAVNDPPSMVAAPPLVAVGPMKVEARVPKWSTWVAPGPDTAIDETTQTVAFEPVSNSNPGLFLSPPVLERTTLRDEVNPHVGRNAALRFTPSGLPGTAQVCFQVIDDGGQAAATNGWGVTVLGSDRGSQACGEVAVTSGPVAYFEASSQRAVPGEAITFEPCPEPLPRCSHDPDGAIAVYLWEFGDGASSSQVRPMHAYTIPGQYDVRLTVFDNHGNRADHVRTVVVQWSDAFGLGVWPAPAPIADAGANRTVLEGSHVELAANHQGMGGEMAFDWRQVSGPRVDLLEAASSQPWFEAPLLATADPVDLVFSLRVTVGAAVSPPDFVVVRVASSNHAPLLVVEPIGEADAGSRIILDASRSRDPDGDRLHYAWEQVLQPGHEMVALQEADGPRAWFLMPDHARLLHFQVRVSDGKATVQDSLAVVASLPPEQPTPVSEETLVVLQPSPLRAEAQATVSVFPIVWGAAAMLLVAVLVTRAVVRPMQLGLDLRTRRLGAAAYTTAVISGVLLAGAVMKAGVGWWGLASFSRLRRADILDHPVRRLVHSHVAAHPGLHRGELARQLGIPPSTIAFHLRQLQRHGYLTVLREPGRSRFFDALQREQAPKQAMAALHSPTAARIAKELGERPGALQADLARRLGLTEAAVHRHLRRLSKAGVLRVQDGKARRWYLTQQDG
jgi:DNA-binding MarR family transcriptional regulator/PKD repeat protein